MSSRLNNLVETSLYVDDLQAAKGFYQRVFGLTVELEENGLVGLRLPGSAVLLLFQRGEAEFGPLSARSGFAHDGSGSRHVCFAVPAGSLSGWERHLMLSGIVVESHGMQGHGGTSLFFHDLDGHSLEMTTHEASALQ